MERAKGVSGIGKNLARGDRFEYPESQWEVLSITSVLVFSSRKLTGANVLFVRALFHSEIKLSSPLRLTFTRSETPLWSKRGRILLLFVSTSLPPP